MSTQSIYRPEGSSKSFWLIVDKMTPKLSFAETGGKMSVHVVECPPGGGPPPHLHNREDEIFYVLEGEFSFIQDDTLVRCPAGRAAYAKRGGVHNFKNTSSGWSKMIVIAVGGPFDEFAAEMADPSTDMVNPPPVTQERIDKLMSLTPKYGIEMKLDWPAPKKTVDAPAALDRLWVLGVRIDFLVTGKQSDNQYLITEVVAGPNAGPPPHTHVNEDECFYVIDGEVEMTLENKTQIIRTGDTIYIPAGTLHGFRGLRRKPSRMISIHMGNGVEGFFRESGTPVDDPTSPPTLCPDFDRVIESAFRNGMRIPPRA